MQEKNPDIPKSIFTMTFTWRRNNNKENPKILQYIQRLRGPFFLSPVTCKVYPIFQIQQPPISRIYTDKYSTTH